MHRYTLIPIALVTLVGVTGCAGYMQPPPGYEASYPGHMVSSKPIDGAIYSEQRALRLFGDHRAQMVGDVITVILNEDTAADKEAETSTSKQTDVDIENPTIFGYSLPTEELGDATLDFLLRSQQSFSGQGATQQSNTLIGTITVTVSEVLPNGNLMLRGEKMVSLNDGNEYVQLSGIVRPYDVSFDNTVLSTQIADARITYRGKGTVASSGKMGWLARFFNSPFWAY